MSTNPYDLHPICISQVDPTSGSFLRAYYFLGSVPKNVLGAAQSGKPMKDDIRKFEWSTQSAAILRNYYGSNWQSVLTPEDPPAPNVLENKFAQKNGPIFFNTAVYRGGAVDFGDFGDFDDFEKTIDDEIKPTPKYLEVNVHASPPIYCDIAILPEDTIYDLRQKLYVASGVAFYRQHLFLYVNEEGPIVPYQITIDSAPVTIDWRDLAKQNNFTINNSNELIIAGISIESRLEERHENLRVAALDTFTLLSPVSSIRVTNAYFVDLYSIILPLSFSDRPNDNLSSILNDKYQFNLLYYGGIMKYWPHLSPDACKMALTDPSKFIDTYPGLSPDVNALKVRYEYEQKISNMSIQWRPTVATTGRALTAVTAVTMRVIPNTIKMSVSIRNIFDWIPTSLSLAAINTKFNIDTSVLTETDTNRISPEQRQGGLITISAVKRHISTYGSRMAPTINWFLSRPLYIDSVSFALSRNIKKEDVGTIPYAFLTIYSDGSYEVSAEWREDDRISFNHVIKELSLTVEPLIATINKMKASAFPIGGELVFTRVYDVHGLHTDKEGGGDLEAKEVLQDDLKANVSLGGITVSAFWPHAITTTDFKELKERFKIYERAGIISIKGLQQSGAYVFLFKKGIVAYDTRLADRAEAGGTDENTNQYSWLTDSTVAARWATSFQGRTVRIFHRATDLRIEIIEADNLFEFELIRRYVFSFLDGLLIGPNRLTIIGEKANPILPDSQRLKRLQERDPNLYDLKKYDQNLAVYSVLCQSNRQPRVYNESELAHLNSKQKESLTKYWNFTDGVPAYYDCPDKKYPFLSFRSGQHPLGYCLPCCKKIKPSAMSRVTLINKKCLESTGKEIDNSEIEMALSRHVFAYGKSFGPDRISVCPRELTDGLFLRALPEPYNLYMVGVEQSTPSIPEAGFAYALAYALSIGNTPPSEIFHELANMAREMTETFYQLGNGAASVFSSSDELAEVIINSFVNYDDGLSPFSPGGAASQTWPNILMDLARHTYEFEFVLFTDGGGGDGDISINISAEAASSIIENGKHTYNPPRIALLISGPMGVYPIAALDPKFFLRTMPEDRWMVARRSFEFNQVREDENTVIDNVCNIIYDIVKSQKQSNIVLPIDLDLILRYIYADDLQPSFSIVARLIGMRGMCYGVILNLSNIEGNDVYIPVRYSPYVIDDIPTLYGPRPNVKLSKVLLDKAIAEINNYIVKKGEPYMQISPTSLIQNETNEIIGFTYITADSALFFFHDATNLTSSPLPKIKFPYNSRQIDEEISNMWRNNKTHEISTQLSPLATEANMRNRLYRLFLAEFSSILRADRNTKIRNDIKSIITNAQFDSPKSVAKLRYALFSLLDEYTDDLRIVREAIARAFIIAPSNPKVNALLTIDATSFNFDRSTIFKLQKMKSHKEVVDEIKLIMGPHIEVVESANFNINNMFASCGEEKNKGLAANDISFMNSRSQLNIKLSTATEHCVNRKLMIPKDRIDDYYSALASDIRNPGKSKLLTSVSAGVFDPLNFIQRMGEHLTVTIN